MTDCTGEVVFLDLRFFNGYGRQASEWYDSLGLEDKVRIHVTQARCIKWTAGRKRILANLPVLSIDVTLCMYDITACIYTPDKIDEESFYMVDAAFVALHPVVI